MTRRKAFRAWVVRWDWQGDHAAVDQPVAAVLPPRTSPERVRQVMEALYAAREYDPADMLSAFRQGGDNPYPARSGTAEIDDPSGSGRRLRAPWLGEVYCGHNPFLYARMATVRPADDGIGIEWEDDPRPGG